MIADGQQNHPILRGITPGSIFGPTDVYAVRLPLPGDSVPLVLGEVTETLAPDSPPVAAKNQAQIVSLLRRAAEPRIGKIHDTVSFKIQNRDGLMSV